MRVECVCVCTECAILIAMDKLRVNDVVIIKLVDDECFEGTIWKIGHECSYVELKNVHDHRENENIPGIQRFHRAEIESIEQIHSGHKGDALQTVPDDLNRLVEYESLKERRQLEKRILQHKIADAIVIQQCDQTYHKALDEIKAQDFVGLSLEGTNLGRLRPSSVLSFSTENNIYIFDIVTFGEIFSEIKAILQAERPIKVVFDSRYIGDNLQHLHKCKLNGVFDLMVHAAHSFPQFRKIYASKLTRFIFLSQVAHFAIVKERTPITLHQCIQAYFISHIKLPDELHVITPIKILNRVFPEGRRLMVFFF